MSVDYVYRSQPFSQLETVFQAVSKLKQTFSCQDDCITKSKHYLELYGVKKIPCLDIAIGKSSYTTKINCYKHSLSELCEKIITIINSLPYIECTDRFWQLSFFFDYKNKNVGTGTNGIDSIMFQINKENIILNYSAKSCESVANSYVEISRIVSRLKLPIKIIGDCNGYDLINLNDNKKLNEDFERGKGDFSTIVCNANNYVIILKNIFDFIELISNGEVLEIRMYLDTISENNERRVYDLYENPRGLEFYTMLSNLMLPKFVGNLSIYAISSSITTVEAIQKLFVNSKDRCTTELTFFRPPKKETFLGVNDSGKEFPTRFDFHLISTIKNHKLEVVTDWPLKKPWLCSFFGIEFGSGR